MGIIACCSAAYQAKPSEPQTSTSNLERFTHLPLASIPEEEEEIAPAPCKHAYRRLTPRSLVLQKWMRPKTAAK